MADGSRPDKRPSLKSVLDTLAEYADSPNIAEELSEEQLSKIGSDVLNEFEIDLRSNDDWMKSAKRSMDIALQVKEAKNYPFENASNIKWPLLTVAALQFNARAYPAIMEGDKIVKAKVIGDDSGIPLPQGPALPPGPGPAELPTGGGTPFGQPASPGQPAGGGPIPATAQPGPGAIPGQLAGGGMGGPPGQPGREVAPQQYLPGHEPGAKQAKADRISEHMSYQLTEEMDGWEEDLDTLTMQLPIVGDAHKKVYYDSGEEQNASDLIASIDLIVNRNTKDVKHAPRVTHRLPLMYPYQIEERMRDKRWSEVDLGIAQGQDGDKDAGHEFLEQHRRIDLDEDGYGEPYIVTIHKERRKVVRIVANYTQAEIKRDDIQVTRIEPREYFVHFVFIPDPKGGYYGIGFGQLLESISGVIDTSFNMMMDAGNLQTAGGGFIGSGVRLKKSEIRLEPGLYRTIDVPGKTIRDAIVNLEHPGPSPVLFQLLGMLLEAAKDITATKDILTGDSGDKNQTATTTLALIEQGLKVFTAIYKRIYRALRKEFRLLYRLNAEHLPEKAYFNILDTPKAVARQDYVEGEYDVCPVADPKVVTDVQKLARVQTLMPFMVPPDPFCDQTEMRRRYFSAVGLDDVDKLIKAMPQGPAPAEILQMQGAAAQIDKTKAETQEIAARTPVHEAQVGKIGSETVKNIAGVRDQTHRRHGEAVDALMQPHQAQMEAEQAAQTADQDRAHQLELAAAKPQGAA